MTTTRARRWRVRDLDDLRDVYDGVFDDVARSAARLAGPDRQLAEDLVQDVFVDVARRVGSGEALELSVGWFVTAVRHRFIDHVRRAATSEQRIADLSAVAGRPEDLTDARTDDDAADLLRRLTDVERLALVMRHVEGCSVREVATAIGRSRRATESLLARARDRVRRTIEEEGP